VGQVKQQQLFNLSGTSIAAPAVAGTVALMLQANPGLTPALVKAILQYSAQPLTGASVLQQGAGLLNADGATRVAAALRTDIASLVTAKTAVAGMSLLAPGKTMPAPTSLINGSPVRWSQLLFAGGNQIVAGADLLTKYQPIYDPGLYWVKDRVTRLTVSVWPNSLALVGVANVPKAIVDSVCLGIRWKRRRAESGICVERRLRAQRGFRAERGIRTERRLRAQ
jgi:hypothetical protein